MLLSFLRTPHRNPSSCPQPGFPFFKSYRLAIGDYLNALETKAGSALQMSAQNRKPAVMYGYAPSFEKPTTACSSANCAGRKYTPPP